MSDANPDLLIRVLNMHKPKSELIRAHLPAFPQLTIQRKRSRTCSLELLMRLIICQIIRRKNTELLFILHSRARFCWEGCLELALGMSKLPSEGTTMAPRIVFALTLFRATRSATLSRSMT